MIVAGIVSEYNPFHNGHQFHVEQTRRITDCDGVIAVMSGNFVQRGEPAVFEKYTRAAAAVAGGADLVLELPAMFAVQSAEFFAKYAVGMLAASGVVNYLSFGAETSDLSVLKQIASVCVEEPREYKAVLRDALAEGNSFPRARGKALESILDSEAAEIAAQPNNLLAIEYLKALEEYKEIVPVAVARKKAAHDSTIANSGFASASLVRQLVCEKDIAAAKKFIPPCSFAKMQVCKPKKTEDYTQAILTQLCKYSIEELRNLPDVSEGLEFRIYRAVRECGTLADLLEQIKSKRYPLSRLRRLLIHALLDMNKEDRQRKPLYLKILDFNETGQKILREMKKNAVLPVVKHFGHVRRLRDNQITELWEREMLFDRIYEL